jgi:hypothetical protein
MMEKLDVTVIVEISRTTMGDDWEYTTCWKSGMACKARCVVTMEGEANMLF